MYNFKYARICDNNQLDDATVTVTATGGYPFSNCLDLKNRNTEFRPSSKSFNIQIDMGSNKRVSFLSILGNSDANFGLSDDAVITLKGNMINLFTGSEAFSVTVPVAELGAFYNVATETEPFGLELRYWELEIDDSLNPDTVAINYIYLGDHIQFIHNVGQGYQVSINDFSSKRFSNTGRAFTVRRPQQRRINGTGISFIRSTDRITLLNTLQSLGTHTPFLFVLDPNENQIEFDWSVTAVYFDGTLPRFDQVKVDYFNIQFAMREVN